MSQPTKKTWPGKPYNRKSPAPTVWNAGDEVLEIDRALAMDRALLMTQLFRAEYFEKIIGIINAPTKDPTAFHNVCASAGIPVDQEKWLWNYLQHYDQNSNWGGTGW